MARRVKCTVTVIPITNSENHQTCSSKIHLQRQEVHATYNSLSLSLQGTFSCGTWSSCTGNSGLSLLSQRSCERAYAQLAERDVPLASRWRASQKNRIFADVADFPSGSSTNSGCIDWSRRLTVLNCRPNGLGAAFRRHLSVCAAARAWRWSSVRAHLGGRHDGVTTLAAVRERYPDFANFLSEQPGAETLARLRSAKTIGRPLGNRRFLHMLERKRSAFSSPPNAGRNRASKRVKCTVTVIPIHDR